MEAKNAPDNLVAAAPASSKQPKPSPNPVDSNSVTQRLQKELMALMLIGDPGISAFPEGENIFSWIGTIKGSKGTVYDGLSYRLSLRTSGLLRMTAEPFSYPFRACWENLTMGVLSIAMLLLCGITKKTTEKWFSSSTQMVGVLLKAENIAFSGASSISMR